MRLEDLKPTCQVEGVHPDGIVTVVSVEWHGSEAVNLTYKTTVGEVSDTLLYRTDEDRLKILAKTRTWQFDGDGALYRLASEAQRIRLAHLFDPLLAIHTSEVDPLPHQITAVYQDMLPRQPLRFLLADDPGAGKTIMAGLLIKELIARGDLERCLIVCPGSLAVQWQDELKRRFHLHFEILTREKLETSADENWFLKVHRVIASVDKLSRDEQVQRKLKASDAEWDLVICDEAHKLSATFSGNDIKYTKRYRLAQLLSDLTRHFLLLTATPHNGKEEDFQLFLALLDRDRFEGRFRDGVHATEVSDLMRRMVKERLLKFDGKPLFPERKANTVPYNLSTEEAHLYQAVTNYVREEYNRAAKLDNAKKTTVGFALTVLQRRLASSPAAIHQSLQRRRIRLEDQLQELEDEQRDRSRSGLFRYFAPELDPEELDDLDDTPEEEVEETEARVLNKATAARSIDELKQEIVTLSQLEELAFSVRQSGQDTKWQALAELLETGFKSIDRQDESLGSIGFFRQKLVVFTEHRDTLSYLEKRISTLLGREDAVVVIHGGMKREARLAAQESFRHDPKSQLLLATDAAGEGINLQCAHLMVNYDLPWNPNRLEQRFGRIHRIGQTEVCHLWNLVAHDTREGDVYRRLLEKLEQARLALGGQVFDVLGKLEFGGRPLRELLLQAVLYGEKPDVKARLDTVVDQVLDQNALRELIEEGQLVKDVMDLTSIQSVRQEMERAEARKLQPHYIESFFREAFQRLSGDIRRREPQRFEIPHVPSRLRNRGLGFDGPILPRYERVVFEKKLVIVPGRPLAAFVCPGHPLLDSVIDLTLEDYRDLLRRGAVLVDERDQGTEPRVLFSVEHALRDATKTRAGELRVISVRMLYVEMSADGNNRCLHYAPYLDYQPLGEDEPSVEEILKQEECRWIDGDLESKAQTFAITDAVPAHLEEIRRERTELVSKTKKAVKERLSKEISYWDSFTERLKLKESTDESTSGISSVEARRRANTLHGRLDKRMKELERESLIGSAPPNVLGGLLVVPRGLIDRMTGCPSVTMGQTVNTQASAERARAVVMETERNLGFLPTDRETEKLGYDIESKDPLSGKLRFIEVKGRFKDAETITVTRNEILFSLNKPDDYILAIVLFADDGEWVSYLRRPFRSEPDFNVTSVNYKLKNLLDKAEDPS